MMIGQFFFVARDLTIEFVRHEVDRGVHIGVFAGRMQCIARDVDRRLGFVQQLGYRQYAMRIHDVVEMSLNPI